MRKEDLLPGLDEAELSQVAGGTQQMPPMPPDSPTSHSLCPTCKISAGQPGFTLCPACQALMSGGRPTKD